MTQRKNLLTVGTYVDSLCRWITHKIMFDRLRKVRTQSFSRSVVQSFSRSVVQLFGRSVVQSFTAGPTWSTN